MDCMFSLKVDGVNTKMLYVDGHFALSLSRGRADGDSFDYTDNSAKVVPSVLKSGKKNDEGHRRELCYRGGASSFA